MNAASGIILLRPDDSARAARLHQASFPAEEVWSANSMQSAIELTSTLSVGLEQAGHLVGLLLVQKTPPDAEILTIAVDPSHRRKGYAQTLLDHARNLLGGHGIDRLLLDVAADNKPAIAFYTRNGFEQDGLRRSYYPREGGAAVDAVLMSRKLAGQIEESKA
ncbi:GNAT family N-acetyltransferase [Henriciella litoralis]|uniref:GNAT family N-acetyltransferase n=1 Tax=Henriciella litoralis TaxID=568102 RepID=UPI000A024262|nr:N-acetyltransferase [Henriciella litoralis]